MSFYDHQTELSPEEQEVRVLFVEQYLFDHDAYKACLRIGFEVPSAQLYAKQFMSETFVLNLIRDKWQSHSLSSEKEVELDKANIIMSLRRVLATGTGGNVVQAAKQLAEIQGLVNQGGEDVAQQITDALQKLAGQVQ